MTGNETVEVPIDVQSHLRPYGVGGDYIGARRGRRAFRLMVLACLGITFSLYFAENYLRYSLSEVQYRMAMTLEDDSQRAILRNVVKRDSADSEVPTARYVAALAYIEEDDIVLARFAEAVELSPDDDNLLIVYGCKLFQMGEFKEARRIFREASLKSTKNALPSYLQAAAIAASSTSEEDFRTAVAMVARTNDSGAPVVFPQPLWHESLPRQGYWYGKLRQDLAVLCCEPLYNLRSVILRRVREELEEESAQGVEGWLYQLQMLGKQLVGDEQESVDTLSSSVVITGIRLQQDALKLRQQFVSGAPNAATEDLDALASRLEEAMSLVVQFESERDGSLSRRQRQAGLPIFMAWSGAFFLAGTSLIFLILNRIVNSDRNARALRQSPMALRVMWVWLAAIALCLIVAPTVVPAYPGPILALWGLLLALIVIATVIFPILRLPSDVKVCERYLSEPEYQEKRLQARRARRKAAFSLAGRYSNIALGLYLCLLCISVVGFRVLTGFYPSDVKFLVSGRYMAEQAVIREVRAML